MTIKAVKERKANALINSPEIMKEWDFERNTENPAKLTKGSNKKVWWICQFNNKHKWQARVDDRNRGKRCPYCFGKKTLEEESITYTHTQLIKEWDYNKNESDPKTLSYGSNKKVWWECNRGHQWNARIIDRAVKGYGCPYCSGRNATVSDNLKVKKPEIANQWHPIKNGIKKPEDVKPHSDEVFWWLCKEGHEWKGKVSTRKEASFCPICCNRKVVKENCLSTIRPDLIHQWHQEKNQPLTPENVTAGSSKRVWWKCDFGHEWESTVFDRARGKFGRCPQCFDEELRTSFPEQTLFFYISKVFSDALNRYQYNDEIEIDVYIPSLKVAIEYDGYYYHEDRREIDERKSRYLKEQGIMLIRVREERRDHTTVYMDATECEMISFDAMDESNYKRCLFEIFDYIEGKRSFSNDKIDKIKSIKVDLSEERIEIYSKYIRVKKEKNLLQMFPELASQWNKEKNKTLTPEHFAFSSNKIVWWKCNNGHEWQQSINSRQRKEKIKPCPYCSS